MLVIQLSVEKRGTLGQRWAPASNFSHVIESIWLFTCHLTLMLFKKKEMSEATGLKWESHPIQLACRWENLDSNCVLGQQFFWWWYTYFWHCKNVVHMFFSCMPLSFAYKIISFTVTLSCVNIMVFYSRLPDSYLPSSIVPFLQKTSPWLPCQMCLWGVMLKAGLHRWEKKSRFGLITLSCSTTLSLDLFSSFWVSCLLPYPTYTFSFKI